VDEDPQEQQNNRFAVLDVFGLTLEVSNPRLAELLTMDASDALTSDLRELTVADRRAVSEALPDSVVTMPTPHTEVAQQARRAFRSRADDLAGGLGFTVESDGTWCSPVGIDIVTRTIDRPLTAATAAHYVSEVAAVTDRLPETSTVLFVVPDQPTADVFKVAIRQRKLHNLMRTIGMDSLESVREMHAAGRLDHRNILVLLAPIADIDVGEIIAVIQAEPPGLGAE
jgi:hypothetical protein